MANVFCLIILQELDKEGRGFIEVSDLGNLLSSLDLFNEEEYVNIMKEKVCVCDISQGNNS